VTKEIPNFYLLIIPNQVQVTRIMKAGIQFQNGNASAY